jgi:nucleotidyltransferase/DNA polymerase involved in DNA repair
MTAPVPLVFDSATLLQRSATGRVAICASHGGIYAASLAARAGVRAVILNDAGFGRDAAGVAGLYWLDGLDIGGCAADYQSARIGDGRDMYESGIISTTNNVAAAIGCRPGMPVAEAAALLAKIAEPGMRPPPEIGETRRRIANGGHREVWALDSVSLEKGEDRRKILVTGSHGGLLGGDPASALKVDAFAAFFNDAGGGKDGAGFARLPVLDTRGVSAATVSAASARIGDGLSTYDTGVLSRVNAAARHLGLSEGMSARQAVARLVGLA